MNKYILFKAGINTAEGLKRLNNDMPLYEDLLKKFTEDSCFQELCAALNANDCPTAFEAAHSLKGISANLSLKRLHEAIAPLTECLRVGDLEAAHELFPPTKEAYEALLGAIRN